mmetsp:Transcript_11242/g.30031  ORF Transcript_11242/g.30031 Transcript_11242/m.30031 type:complete len:227 (+) Transcript_11242:276-956(+)
MAFCAGHVGRSVGIRVEGVSIAAGLQQQFHGLHLPLLRCPMQCRPLVVIQISKHVAARALQQKHHHFAVSSLDALQERSHPSLVPLYGVGARLKQHHCQRTAGFRTAGFCSLAKQRQGRTTIGVTTVDELAQLPLQHLGLHLVEVPAALGSSLALLEEEPRALQRASSQRSLQQRPTGNITGRQHGGHRVLASGQRPPQRLEIVARRRLEERLHGLARHRRAVGRH